VLEVEETSTNPDTDLVGKEGSAAFLDTDENGR
jgi:hypothetical protein